MITLLKNKEFNKYKTIWTKDRHILASMFLSGIKFKQDDNMDTRWQFIDNKEEVKRILEENFSSIGRGEPYEEGLPSGTVLSSSLFPVDLIAEIWKLTWLNNEEVSIISAQEEKNLISLEMGTYVHKCIETWLTSSLPMKDRTVERIVELVNSDSEILEKIPDIATKRIRYENLAYNLMPQLIEKVLCKYDIIGSEVFINIGTLQGSIDFLAKKDGYYYIIDWKTTAKKDKKTGKRKFSGMGEIKDYIRQLCVYTNMLIKAGYIPSSEKHNIRYRLYQIHLTAEEYKEFSISSEDILKWEDDLEKVMDWYTSIKEQ
jgi:hypothetical protein